MTDDDEPTPAPVVVVLSPLAVAGLADAEPMSAFDTGGDEG